MSLLKEMGFNCRFRDLTEEQAKAYKAEAFRRYVARNKDSRRAYMREYLREYSKRNPEKVAAYREKRAEKKRVTDAAYRARNREKAKAHSKSFRQKNPHYARDRYHTDPEYRIRTLLRGRLSAVFPGGTRSFSKSLGVERDVLVKHIEAQFQRGMTWENHGKVWHVDHIIPCAAFDLTKPEEVRRCFNYLNLRPLRARDNLTKSAKIIPHSQIPLGL